MSPGESRRPQAPRVVVAAWSLVLAAAGLEIFWALALTASEGLRHAGWAVLGIAIAIASLIMLTRALRILPLGTAYTVWVGLGAVGVAAAGALVLDEPLTWPRAACLALIIGGVVGLARTDTPRKPRQQTAVRIEGGGGGG
ncbi:DMT family transporter [Saccharomonospora cyanea]|uniref:Cation/cationic drug transporter n=1 Tax=Saccharomonospora cyanea NA-134 TaxID=882082 RepID=H5XPC9_9PSEU|nr:SMR family transporter [Saccharomonospora cyanea]EHR58963.1 cation/cationic drug transporter [Saccharomonospora cyanea NA-134]